MAYKQKLFNSSITMVTSLSLILVCAFSVFADVNLPSVISNNMVLQRSKKVPIWGWAQPGEKVKVKASWQWFSSSTKADEKGQWMVKVKTPKGPGPYEITIKAKNEITLENVLAGEVWVCSGQSNMAWTVGSSSNAEQEIAAAQYPQIRLFTVQKKVAEQPQSDCKGNWVLCSPETVKSFSAVAYFFGRELHEELKVPVGLIHTSWGGTPAESWTRQEVLESDANFAPIFKRFADLIEKYPEAKKEYDDKFKQWQEAADQARAEGKEVPRKPRAPWEPKGHPHRPAGLYNVMIAPLIPYRIAGAIWYQGEANARRAYQYRRLFPAMIRNWRSDWDQGNFPFLFVQLANWRAVKDEPYENAWSELREAQLMTLSLPNTGMAVAIDIGDANSIHPRNKQDVGKRLALWAFAKAYGKRLVYSGPIYKSMTIKGNKIVLNFKHIGGGLVTREKEPMKGFAIAGPEREFVWADAEIDGDTVVVSNDKIQKPVAVRYAWAENPICNLYNKQGLPASPFRTDDWPGVTIEKK